MLKRIKTQEDIHKSKRRSQIIIGIILVGLMVLSTAGYAIIGNEKTGGEGSTKTDYNGFKFIKQQGFWITEANGKVFIFQSLPQELENFSISGNFNIQDYSGKPIYIVNNNPAAGIIIQNLGETIERYQEACLEGRECTNKELPIKTCKDNVIVFLPEEDKGVYKQENCVFVTGNLNKGADAFDYKLAGIM